MTPELPDRLLGIEVDEERDRSSKDEDVELKWFVLVTIGELRLAVPVDEVRAIVDPPESITRIPRTPDAVEGVIDLRGEITAVIEPRVHFPAEEPPAEKQKLLVIDRPMDRQQAAIRVDEVAGVVGVPEENVKDETEYETSDVAGGALTHPLVVGIVEEEQTATVDAGETTRPDRPDERRGGLRRSRDITSKFGTDEGDEIGQEFTLDEDEEEEEEEEVEQIVVEMTAMIDVEGMLRASGRAVA